MAGLRVISGKARGHRLIPVPGDTTRPITDRTKESLFNILGADIVGATFLDLFAGTGSVGIEALSRGASYVRFVDNNRLAIQTIRSNLKKTGLETGAEVIQADAFKLLAQPRDKRFDYIYIAPPQYKGMWERTVMEVDKNSAWLSPDAWIIVQIHPVEYVELTEHMVNNLQEIDQRKYGSTLLVFYETIE